MNARGLASYLVVTLFVILIGGEVASTQAQTTYVWSGATSTNWSTTTNWTANGNPGAAGSGTTDIVNLNNFGATTSITYDTGASGYIAALNMIQTTNAVNTLLTLKQNLTLTSGTSTIYSTTAGNQTLDLGTFTLTVASGATLSLGDTTAVTPKGGSSTIFALKGGTAAINGTLLLTENASSTGQFSPWISSILSIGSTGTLQVNSNTAGGTRLTLTSNFSSSGAISFGGTTPASSQIFFGGATNAFNAGTTFSGASTSNLWFTPGTGGQTTSTAVLLPGFTVRNLNAGTSGTPVTTTETFSSSATTGAVSNAINTVTLTNTGVAYATTAFTLGGNLNLASGTTPFTFAYSGTTTGSSDTIDLAGYRYDTTTSSSNSTVAFVPTGTTAGTNQINLVNSGASSASGGNGVFKAGAFTLNGADVGVGNGVILQATNPNGTSNLGTQTSGVTTVNAGSTFYYTGVSGSATTGASLISARSIGNLTVGDGVNQSVLSTGSTINALGITTVNAGSILDVHSVNYLTTTGLEGSGTVTNFSGTGAALLTINATGIHTFSGVLKEASPSASFAMNLTLGSGYTGTQILSGANTYKGATTVNGGTLLVTGTSSGGGAVAVNSGGRLGGAGGTITSSGVTVASGGGLSISAGGAAGVAAGTLTLALGSGSLNLSAAVVQAGELSFVLGSNAGTSDKVVLSSASSTLNIGAGLLSLADFTLTTGSTFGAGTYILFDTNSASGIAGSLASTGLTGTLGGYAVTLGLATDGSGFQDVVLNVVAVPEPAVNFLLSAGAAGLLALRRRKSLRIA